MWYIRAGRCRGAQIFTILIWGPPVTTNIWAGARTAQGFFGDCSLYLDAISRIGSLCRSNGGWARDEKQDNNTVYVVGFCR